MSSRKIRVLAIAPYNSMAKQLTTLVKNFPAIDLTVNVGDREEGIRLAQENYHSNFDIILSRGGTATLLHNAVSLPVIEIETSAYDILSILQLAYIPHKTAVIGYPNITRKFKSLSNLLGYELALYEITSEEHIEHLLYDIVGKKYESLIGDVAGYTAARKLGLRSYLITSSDESILDALRNVNTFYDMNYQLANDNLFFRSVLQSPLTKTVVLASDGKLIYSNNSDSNMQALLKFLREKINSLDFSKTTRLHFQTHNLIYKVYARTVTDVENAYIAFDYSVNRIVKSSQSGINYYNCDDVSRIFNDSIYGILSVSSSYLEILNRYNKLINPIFLTGEYGLSKSCFAMLLYLRSPYTHSTYIHINADLLDERSWAFLMENHRSPLCETDCTICFSNVDSLSESQQRELLSFLLASQLFRNNRLIFSFSESPKHEISEIALQYKNKLYCDVISLIPLRNNVENIKHMAALYLNWLNMSGDKSISNFDPKALSALAEYRWPENYFQFQRVLNSCYNISTGNTITQDDIQKAFETEKQLVSIGSNANGHMQTNIDLSHTLDEINRKIARQVLDNFKGNHTKASRSLNISRTTLWRMLR